MLNSIIRFSLNHRLVVLAVAAVVSIAGLVTVAELPIDVFPDINRPTVTVLTEAHGMAPEEVETRVTAPLEAVLNGLPGLERIRSQSGIGLSVIYLEFEWGTDLFRNRQLTQEKLTVARSQLPADEEPVMGPISSLMGQIQMIALVGEDGVLDPLQVRDVAEWVVRPRLMTIPGVAQVISIGGGLKQYQILISAEKMNRYQLSLPAVDEALSRISQNTTGGFLDQGGREFLIRNIGIVESMEDIRRTLVGLHFGRPIFVGDIAEVKEAPRLQRGTGSYKGSPSVVMTVQKQPGADTVAISRAIDQAIADLRPSLPKGLAIHPDIFKQANFIRASIEGIQGKLQLGTVLVFVVLFIFLANMRMSLITLAAIPLSFLMTFLVFRFFGLSVNTMTLGGLAIAIGELVDDSIVDVENIHRRLRENAAAGRPKSVLRVVYDASREIRNSIVLATLIIALVFLPLFNLTGLEGRLFTPLAVAYLTALLSSLLVSLTVTPVLCSFLLKGDIVHDDTRFVSWLKRLDRRMLESVLSRPKRVLTGAVALGLVAAALVPFMGADFLPRFNEGTAMISVASAPGISLAASDEIGRQAEALILRSPEVLLTSRRTGRAEMDEHAMGVNVSEIDVDFKSDGRPRDVVLEEIRDRLKTEIPGAGIGVGQPLSHLIDHMLSGVSAAIAVKIFGPDLATLRRLGAEAREALAGTPGLVDLRVEQQGLIPQVKIQVLREEAAQFALSPGDITTLLEPALNGETVTQILENNRMYDVFYRFDDESRADLDRIRKTVLRIAPDGRKVRLEDVADVYETTGPNEINRENGMRRIVISANAAGRDLGGIATEIQQRLKEKLKLPEGYSVTLGGQFESQRTATRRILLFGALAVLGIAFILYGQFRSLAIVLQIMLTIPFAFIGGVLLLFATDRTFTVASLVGFITLCGVASRNGIMMISHYLHLMKEEGAEFSRETIIRGSQERLIPVMMTALVASLALLPLVFSGGEPGSEILHPVAVVIVGGLLSSTILDLIVTPTLFFAFGRRSAERFIDPKHKIEFLEETP